MKRSSNIKLWIWAAAIAAVLMLTHIPQEEMPQNLGMYGVDKILHVGAYGLLGLVGMWAVGRPVQIRKCLLVMGLLAFVAAVDELTQPIVGRTCGLGDWLADILGIVLAVLAVKFIWGRDRGN